MSPVHPRYQVPVHVLRNPGYKAVRADLLAARELADYEFRYGTPESYLVAIDLRSEATERYIRFCEGC